MDLDSEQGGDPARAAEAPDPGRPIWILTAILGALGLTTCLGLGVFVAVVGDHNPLAQPAGSPFARATSNAPDLSPRRVNATITRVHGDSPVTVGAHCNFDVVSQPLPQGGYWCQAQVRCAGHLIYGGPQAGFFPCQLGTADHLVGQDASTTSIDGDSAFAIDTPSGHLSVEDDSSGQFGAFRVEGKVDSVR